MTEASPSDSSIKTALVGAVSAIVVAGLGALGLYLTGSFGYASKDEGLRLHFVEIAIGILRADPTKEDVPPARGWAIDVIERNSSVPLPPGDRDLLLHRAIKTSEFDRSFDRGLGNGGVGGINGADLARMAATLKALEAKVAKLSPPETPKP